MITIASLTAALSGQQADSAPPVVAAVGEPAPPLDGLDLLGPDGTTPFDATTVAGKAIVLEFWATWCVPCVAAMPHLDELARSLRDEPIEFLAVTDEKEARVRAFLAERDVATRIALDTAGGLRDRFRAYSIPHTIVIDRGGKVVAMTTPEHLTEATLRDVIAGRAIELPRKEETRGDPRWYRDPEAATGALCHVLVERVGPETRPAVEFHEDDGYLAGDGIPLDEAIRMAWDDLPYPNLASTLSKSAELAGTRVRFAARGADGTRAAAAQALRAVLPATFGFRAEWRLDERLAATLRRIPGVESAGLRPAANPSGRSGGAYMMDSLKLENMTMAALVPWIGHYLGGTPVIDETGLTGRYDVDWAWKRDDQASFEQALRESGIDVVVAARPVRVLFVEPVER